MAKVVAVLTADAHLQKRAWADRFDLAGDAYYGFEQLVDFSVKHGAQYFIEAGDGIDVKYNESEVVRFGRHALGRLKKANTRFCFVQGDHDYQETPWFTAIAGEFALHLHGKVTNLPGLGNVFGWDYTRGGLTKEIAAEMSGIIGTAGCSLAVMHQKWKELLGFEGSYDSTFDMVPGEIHTLLTGDKHGHAALSHDRDRHLTGVAAGIMTNRLGTLNVYSPGATCKQSIAEPDTHSFYAWMSDNTIKSMALRSRPVLRVAQLIDSEQRFNGLLASLDTSLATCAEQNKDLPKYMARPIFYVEYTTQVANFYDRLLNALNDRAFLFEKARNYAAASDTTATQRAAWDKTIAQGLPGALDMVVIDEGLRHKAKRLLAAAESGGDIRTVLQQLKKEHSLGRSKQTVHRGGDV